LLRRAGAHFGVAPGQAEIRFDLRGRAAGQVRFPADEHPVIRFNPVLLRENGADFLARTVPHEVAHVIAFRLHGPRTRPHGHEWRQVMRVLGADPSRCHSFDTTRSSTRRLRRHLYHCACREHLLTSIRHNRVGAGQTYRCVACGEVLRRGGRCSGALS
jgi:SprT protein